jgi:hypothetical protein
MKYRCVDEYCELLERGMQLKFEVPRMSLPPGYFARFFEFRGRKKREQSVHIDMTMTMISNQTYCIPSTNSEIEP